MTFYYVQPWAERWDASFTLSSLLLVRKSVEGLRIAVMALASSSWTVLVPLAV